MNGRVQLRIETLMPDRLIRRAMAEGARFHRIERPDRRTLVLEADPRSAQLLAALCERFSLPCEVLSRTGADAVLRRLKRRATLLAGILTCLVCLSMFLSRIWLVDVELTGGRTADLSPIEEALASMGVRPGMAKSGLDPDLLSDALSASSDAFSFISVRVQGVRLLVKAAPAVAAPELYRLEAAGDLVAQRDGVVLSVNVESGVPCVAVGDTVVRGQVLIRGEERVSKEETTGIAARGTVIARTWCMGEASAPRFRTETPRTGRSSLSAVLALPGRAWPLLEGESYPEQETETEILPIVGLFLPLEIQRTTAWEIRPTAVAHDEAALLDALAALARAEARLRIHQGWPDADVPAGQWTETISGAPDQVTVRAVYEIHTDIAVTRDRWVQQGGSYVGNP